MTDRVRTLTVILDKDIRIDDVDWIVNAIRSIKHVEGVTPNTDTGGEHFQRELAKSEIRREVWAKISEILCPEWKK